MQAQNLTHAELLSSLHRFANDERQALAGFLLSLIEANRRKLHVREAQTSLFDWLTGTFGFSESAASRRIRVVRLLERLPSLEQEVIIRDSQGADAFGRPGHGLTAPDGSQRCRTPVRH